MYGNIYMHKQILRIVIYTCISIYVQERYVENRYDLLIVLQTIV